MANRITSIPLHDDYERPCTPCVPYGETLALLAIVLGIIIGFIFRQ